MTDVSVLIVDDEPLARGRLRRMLGAMHGVRVAGEAGNAVDACQSIAVLKPDLLLLDIQMPGADGFELLDRLGDAAPPTIFVTAFDHHALRAFDARAIDYVTKPVEPGRLASAVERARLAAGAQARQGRIVELQETVATLRAELRKRDGGAIEFWVRYKGEHLRIPSDRISHIQAERDYVRLHADGQSHLYYESLASLERRLDPAEFVRIHRSTIVRRDRVLRLRGASFAALIVHLDDGSEVRVGRTYAKAMRRMLNGPA
ncbi:LytR/AlgR family response regulator transcription factor [Sphingomonas colocasiae]|uniref:LytTR family DNA-binding domain-containing protein n=1 Tax=Sphingomonas colocasiae TaxID=1848973 RepID=A0ABS7PRM3_9SPHN|nr:LytTR family DNA-binding domain-containing protein [Sphingomonas colocasiae]MBY8823878.1 LytTR family DNA-binding domain-containing protein [Sphingomonas colocasiae]